MPNHNALVPMEHHSLQKLLEILQWDISPPENATWLNFSYSWRESHLEQVLSLKTIQVERVRYYDAVKHSPFLWRFFFFQNTG